MVSALISACPKYVNRHPRTLSNTTAAGSSHSIPMGSTAGRDKHRQHRKQESSVRPRQGSLLGARTKFRTAAVSYRRKAYCFCCLFIRHYCPRIVVEEGVLFVLPFLSSQQLPYRTRRRRIILCCLFCLHYIRCIVQEEGILFVLPFHSSLQIVCVAFSFVTNAPVSYKRKACYIAFVAFLSSLRPPYRTRETRTVCVAP